MESLRKEITSGLKALGIALPIFYFGPRIDAALQNVPEGGASISVDTDGINMPEECVATAVNTTVPETSCPSNETSGSQDEGDGTYDRTKDDTLRSPGTTSGNKERTNNIVYADPQEGRDYQIQNNKLVIYGPKERINIRFEDILRSIPSDNNVITIEVEDWGLDLDDIKKFKSKYPRLKTVITSQYYSLCQNPMITQYCEKNNITITSPVEVAINNARQLTPKEKAERLQKQIASILG